jgi:hypothetical protein
MPPAIAPHARSAAAGTGSAPRTVPKSARERRSSSKAPAVPAIPLDACALAPIDHDIAEHLMTDYLPALARLSRR